MKETKALAVTATLAVVQIFLTGLHLLVPTPPPHLTYYFAPLLCTSSIFTSAAAPYRNAALGGAPRGLATVYLGLGSNVGDKHANLLKAYKGLREVWVAAKVEAGM